MPPYFAGDRRTAATIRHSIAVVGEDEVDGSACAGQIGRATLSRARKDERVRLHLLLVDDRLTVFSVVQEERISKARNG